MTREVLREGMVSDTDRGAARPRKVLYVSWKTEGGSAFSLFHLAGGLDSSRHEPTVLFCEQQNDHIVDRLRERGVPTIVLGGVGGSADAGSGREPRAARRRPIAERLERALGAWAGRAWLELRAFREFRSKHAPRSREILRTIREKGIDLVHVNDGLPLGKAAILAARRAGVPCVCHVRMFQRLTRYDLRFGRYVDRFVYISRAIGADYERQGIPQGQGLVVHNAVDLRDYLDGAADSSGVRAEFGWAGGEKLVGVVGRLDWWKGHEHFIEAMARALREEPLARGLIVGQFETSARGKAYGEDLVRRTSALGLDGKVVFTGFRKDVPRLLRALDVVVLSSSEPEPFGRVIIEGMAASKPIVATDAGGVPDIVDDGATGILVPCRDAGAMAAAIVRLLRDPELAERMGRAGRERVAERFTVERHVAAVQAVYDEILARRR